MSRSPLPRRRSLAALLSTLAVGLATWQCAAPPPPPRHVLLIVIDTLRADHLGVYGYERPTSPEIDRWAERGVVFERAFTTSPWTVPAFGSILTGLLPSSHGGGFPSEGATHIYDRTGVAEGARSIAEVLRDEGLTTVSIASNPFLKPHFGMAKGFDSYQQYRRRDGAPYGVDRLLGWIEKHRDEPFFAMVHFMEPHLPYRPPAPFRGRFTGEPELRELTPLKELRAIGDSMSDSDRAHYIGRYDEEVAFLDSELGRMFAGLGERWEDTLVILTADHGEELLDHGSFDHGHTLMQELLHVPLILWAPGLEPRRVSVPVSLVDVPATILEALGVAQAELGSGRPGRSMWGLASGEVEQRQGPIFAERVLFGSERKAVIRWPFKLIVDMEDGSRQLFDLEEDPDERRDLAVSRPDLADRLEAELRRSVELAASTRGRAAEIDEATGRELEALGYVD